MLIGFGTALLVLAALLFLLAMGSGSSDVGSAWLLTFFAGALFQLGLVLALAGAIMRAIWFLPGDETKMPPRV